MLRAGLGGEPTRKVRLAAVLYFISSSMLVQFTTKATFTTFDFRHPLTVALAQMAFVAPVSYFVAHQPLTLDISRTLLPMALVNVLNVVCGLVATASLNVPMFIALRRFTLLFTLLLERFWLRRTHDWATLGAMTLTIGGALLAAVSDPALTIRGVLAVLANDALTSLYLIVVKSTPTASTLSTTGTLFYNATLSLPLLGVAVALTRDLSAVARFPLLLSPSFIATFAGAAALGLSINHSTFLCTRLNEPLATSIAGNLKNALMTLAGAFMFGDYVFTPTNAAGLAISMVGAIWYATKSAYKARPFLLMDLLTPVCGAIAGFSDMERTPPHDRPDSAR